MTENEELPSVDKLPVKSSNVVQFPKSKIVRDGVNVEQLREIREKSLQNFAEELTNEIASNIIADLSAAGLDLDKKNLVDDLSFVFFGLRSAIYRTMDLEHPLQTFVDEHKKEIEEISNNFAENEKPS
jgi:hypothetical protein